ncbi:MAG: hypothetical protein D8M58_17090 [Calditrichaeota bacterium]|nr:MAG: hypothetical protein DWQ03_12220 [Calditrichota bacterium]MBL1207124.1 hypothetical protein [Calditrichota bacterium]NOG46954.1 hypothetical protein [Calditrichota bacterium]
MKEILSFIITHGNLADELNKVSQKFLPTEVSTYTYSNQKDSIEKIVSDTSEIIIESKADNIIIFVDLMGGSCWHAAMTLKKNFEKVSIITGVNIPSLVSFSTNFNKLEWSDLIEKIEVDSKKAIRAIK